MAAQLPDEQRLKMIAETAYFRAEQRGFQGGDPVEDWIEAEAEVDARLARLEHDDVLAQLDERLTAAGDKLKELRKKAASVGAEAKVEWQRDLERLEELRAALQKRTEELRGQGHEAGNKLRQQAEKLWGEITDVISHASARKRTARSR